MSFARIFHKIFQFFSIFLITCNRRKLPIITACQFIGYRFRGAELGHRHTDFQRYTCKSAVNQFATIARMLNSALESETDEAAAEKSGDEIDKFLKEIGMRLSLEGLKVPENELLQLARQCLVLPDYKSNPRIATLEDVAELLKLSFRR